MEKIKINEIVKKDSGLVIVKYYNPQLDIPSKMLEATMNTKWQAQDVDYLVKDVGVGGTVSVLIQVKGDYTNITKVDMASAVKGEMVRVSGPTGKFIEGGEKVEYVDGVKKAPTGGHEDWQDKAAPQEAKPNPQRVGLFIKLAVEMGIAHPNKNITIEENLCQNIQEIKKL